MLKGMPGLCSWEPGFDPMSSTDWLCLWTSVLDLSELWLPTPSSKNCEVCGHVFIEWQIESGL